MQDLSMIDPHHHLWELGHGRYPWLERRPLGTSVAGNLEPIAHSYLLSDYLADAQQRNLVKSVHVECGWNPADPVEESRWLQGLADALGFPHGIVAHADLADPDIETVLAKHAEFRNLRGIRHIVNWHRDPNKTYVTHSSLLRDEQWLSGFSLLHKFNLSFDLQLYPSQMADGATVAARYPETQMILNHAGMPVDRDTDGITAWRGGMRLLAAKPNVAVKISGLGMVDWRWTTESIRPFVIETIELFGTERCMFASNFPVDKLYSDFNRLYGAFDEITKDFTVAERCRLFHGNAERIYRL
jgi:predicted TIM-barrel fold metal-dependent hydrolase